MVSKIQCLAGLSGRVRRAAWQPASSNFAGVPARERSTSGFGHQEAPQEDGEEEAPQAPEEDAHPASPRRQVISLPDPPVIDFGGALVVVLVRDGCHLCVEALRTIEQVCTRAGVSWRSIDVDGDEALRVAYTDHVPVTFVAGVEHGRWFVDHSALAAAVQAAC